MNAKSALSFVGLSLLLSLCSVGCGQLPPSEAARINRERIEREQEDAVVISAVQWDQTGAPDLAYTLSYNAITKLFRIKMARANRLPESKELSLADSDHPTVHSSLVKLFHGKLKMMALGTCPSCANTPQATVVLKDNTSTQHPFAFLTITSAGGATQDVFDLLNTFILDHL